MTVADPAGNTDLNTADNSATVNAAIAAGGSVVGRSLFYLDSFFDGNNGSNIPTTSDFTGGTDGLGAIATDKVPLLPGQKASYANVSNFATNAVAIGIDGIFVDLTGDIPGSINASDFEFTIGNSSTPGTGSSPGTGWSVLGVAPTVTVFAGQGVGGSDRFALTWPAGTIENKWLQITVKQDANTGLGAPDVFYFGSAPGDTGNSTTDFDVNATDEIDARNDPHNFANRAPITNPNDFNRDSFVNATDETIARAYPTNFSSALKVISVPGLPNSQGVSSPASAPASSSTVSMASLSSLATSNTNTATIDTTPATAVPPVSIQLQQQNPPVIQVGNYTLLANTPNQKIQIFVAGGLPGGDNVQGADVEVQIADGGPAAGGKVSGPKITHVDVLTNTIFAKNNNGQAGVGSIVPQVFEATTLTASGTVKALGLLATITVDTTGFTGGVFPLLLTGTLNGNTDFTLIPANVSNGTITLLPPPPPPKGSVSGNVFSDKNGNGKQDKGEAGLAGWTVDVDQLVNGREVVVATAVTDKNGSFDAKGLKAGAYEVVVVNQPKKAKPTGKSLTGYHLSLGTGQNAVGYSFGEKPIA